MLHGIGLKEPAACAGLSENQVANFLHHRNGRNNRAVLFITCAAFMLHALDILLVEFPELKDEIAQVFSSAQECNSANHSSAQSTPVSRLIKCITEKVTENTVQVGRLCGDRLTSFFKGSPNGNHFINTVLLICLLPTVGFHILTLTGHTNMLDSFWLRLQDVLHTSGHLKYQEVYLFYAIFRCTMPRATFAELFRRKTGSMVCRVPSFIAGLGCEYDARGWTYVHLDEALEMLIIRQVKGLNTSMLPYLESCGAWLLVASKERMLMRKVTAASSAYQRTRNYEHDGSSAVPLCM